MPFLKSLTTFTVKANNGTPPSRGISNSSKVSNFRGEEGEDEAEEEEQEEVEEEEEEEE